MMAQVFLLLVLFQIKHWLCDYPFQTAYMLQKGRFSEWMMPLFFHAAVHFMGTLGVILLYLSFAGDPRDLPVAVPLAALDLAIHFVVDRIKASPAMGGRWAPKDRYFWWALGADQAAHHLTHYFIIWCLLRGQA